MPQQFEYREVYAEIRLPDSSPGLNSFIRALEAVNRGPHYNALRTVEKFAGPTVADALGKRIGARTIQEETIENSTRFVPWRRRIIQYTP